MVPFESLGMLWVPGEVFVAQGRPRGSNNWFFEKPV